MKLLLNLFSESQILYSNEIHKIKSFTYVALNLQLVDELKSKTT